MITIIILSLLLASSAVVMVIQFLKLRKFNKDPFNSPNVRRGIIYKKLDTYTTAIIEIRAIKLSGGLSRVKLIKVTGVKYESDKRSALDNFPEFIETNKITFIDEAEVEENPFGVKS